MDIKIVVRTLLFSFILIIPTAILVQSVSADELTFEWVETFGGSNDDSAESVKETSDGGYIIAGWTYSFGDGESDVYLVKTNSNGNEMWSKTFGGSYSDRANSVQEASDGGYIIAGYTKSFGSGKSDVYLIKTDSNGNVEWSKTFGSSNDESASSIQQTSDGGYIIAGSANSSVADKSDVYLIKTDSNGNVEWSKTFGGYLSDKANSVQQTSDGGYIIAGWTYSFGVIGKDFYLIKTDSKGNEEWSKTFGGSDDELAESVQQTSDGGYIIAGWTYFSSEGDAYLIKTDSNGNEMWSKTVSKILYSSEGARSVQETYDGGYIIVGWSGTKKSYFIKTDSNGNELWSETLKGSKTSYKYRDRDSANSVKETSGGGYIIAGVTKSFSENGMDAYLLKLSVETPKTVVFAETPRIVVLTNSIDYDMATDFIEFLKNKDLEVVHAFASDFITQYKNEKFIVILGGPNAYDGVGEIVRDVLSVKEGDFLRTKGNRKMFVKTNVWTQGQVLIVLAGSDRYRTQDVWMENKENVPTYIILSKPKPDINISELEIQIHNLINKERDKQRLYLLEWSDKLATIARNHSQDMANRSYFSITSPEGYGISDRYKQAGVYCQRTQHSGGQQIFMFYLDNSVTQEEIAELVFEEAMSDHPDLGGITYRYYGREGVGVAISDKNELYVTINFC